uniref:3'-5' exonuclease domain-containing protein n=1 Tax=Acrobeloides nanus TaxID=290746 RepID=A0A914CEM8_9BILA
MDLDNIEEYMDIFTHNHNAVKQPFALLDDDDDDDKFLSIAYDSESDSSLISSLKGINKEYRELVPKLIALFKLNTDDITKESKLSTIKNAFVNLFKSANAQRNDESHVGAFPLFLTLLKDLYEYLVQTCSLPRDHFGSIYNAFDAFWSFYSDLEIFDKIAVLNQPVMKDNWFQSLKVVSTFNHKYIDMISTIFCLNDERSRQDFLPYLVKICWDLLTVEHYLEKSVRWAIYFRLKPHLDKDENKTYLKEIVLQCCIFNNKVLFEEYIGDSVEDKKFVLRLLDGYMNMADYPGTRLKSTYVKPEYSPLEEKFLGEDNLGGRNKRMSHLTVSYLKKWDLSVDLIPKTMYHRAVDFIIFKHVMAEKEKTSDLNYEESLQHICEGRHDVQLFLLDHLIYRGINRQALIWAGLFKIPCEEWPAELRFYVNRNPEKLVEVTKYIQLKMINEEQLKKQRNLVFSLFETVDEEPYNVYTIDNKGYLEAAIKEIEKSEGEGGLIGVDCEWKPPGIMINEELALIQIACHAAVFLIDIVELEKILAKDEWKAFFIRIFCNPKITKIGFDFRNDLRVMCNTFPFLREYKNVIVDSTICLFNFCNKFLWIKENKSAIGLIDHFVLSRKNMQQWMLTV